MLSIGDINVFKKLKEYNKYIFIQEFYDFVIFCIFTIKIKDVYRLIIIKLAEMNSEYSVTGDSLLRFIVRTLWRVAVGVRQR